MNKLKNITNLSSNYSMNNCCEVNGLNLAKKLTPPPKFLTYNYFNQTNFKKSKNYNNKSKKFQNIFAFSLIELSIVLIIIGLLIAGVVGGQSLIESAKIINIITQFQNIEKQIYAFTVEKGREPGDVNNDGLIDHARNVQINYKNTDFAFPYNGTDASHNHYIPDVCTAPFVELYTSDIGDFEPTGDKAENDALNTLACRNTAKNGGLPFSQVLHGNFFSIGRNYKYDFNSDISEDKSLIYLQSYNDEDALLAVKAEKLDFKIDDGKLNSGRIRTYCRKNGGIANSYYESISTEKVSKLLGKCPQIIYYYR